ncbi:hypothetical protein A2634_00330 [Candidatus Amesbacteria bacterium RIFCSPHIGHO2_01_FULL_48_32]|uniref:Uncharacterized protein n=1 Tax=Candidatus Amesbacteria bacterium RIFCSPLOWO2_01_FULL_48_25 TaxID=1797259 RepID=A0A1F4ZAN7_9BACT|nr:MAG: hypothetical protein A2634_00330 [Candidatus Amesbacteria bacterium RIFCSPHIGHO2_01_FULL_48_32]OGD03255.1 MAG: hypothetical protein A2989_00280 [Candidatus Amesbacteria bacterium RIFCSPLOWO2_01_FULL_48_25]HJZ05202.1 isopentenyl transferase family protein [Patescibacteria group bacterium]
MSKVLIISGPTATGKTKLALEIAQKFSGEIVSADSRQVYTGKNLIHGKDLPPNPKAQISSLKWRSKNLKYYVVDGIKIWLYDVVNPGEEFNVSFWKECADLVISDIISRKKLPIIVGGTGLFIKSLTHDLSTINVPLDRNLRKKLENQSPEQLFNYLKSINEKKADNLNDSDRHNPRRLIRAIEISLAPPPLTAKTRAAGEKLRGGWGRRYLQIGLIASRDFLYQLVDQRIASRISAGAVSEDSDLAAHPESWQSMEHKIIRHQLTWFATHPPDHWFYITKPSWQSFALSYVDAWYNESSPPS